MLEESFVYMMVVGFLVSINSLESRNPYSLSYGRSSLVFKSLRDNAFEHLFIQFENLEAITRLNASIADFDVNALVRAIARLRNTRWAAMFQWILHEANKLADAMAKLDTSHDLSLFVIPPAPCYHFWFLIVLT
ncbi:hypothetical protein V6N11_017395 [Hibiscus sabdariffa]|uniref:RNase H type-1 domain-containing protein n=1 Tax=Hibiscus sabdariffa TaxID=183260 RepID=A0ABR2TXW0_9ROSI